MRSALSDSPAIPRTLPTASAPCACAAGQHMALGGGNYREGPRIAMPLQTACAVTPALRRDRSRRARL